MIVKCPRCGKEAEIKNNPFRPFCSERCRWNDLGLWLEGAYRFTAQDSLESGIQQSTESPETKQKYIDLPKKS